MENKSAKSYFTKQKKVWHTFLQLAQVTLIKVKTWPDVYKYHTTQVGA